jgi:hypothetical protein
MNPEQCSANHNTEDFDLAIAALTTYDQEKARG